MTCSRCRKKFAGAEPKCPHCGQERPAGAQGVFQSSTVLIAADGAEMVYRSMEEVPDPLRTKLLKSTNGANSATILIADRRGREEIARVMRNLPGAPQRKGQRAPLHSLLAGEAPARSRLTPRRKQAIYALLLVVVIAVVALVFVHPR
jgi:hypothetical protein